jgi:hypothetical protein
MIRSYEPGEDWFWDYKTERTATGPQLASPEHHPVKQGVPGPADRVPEDWQEHLH